MDNVWLASALWIGLALIASVLSVWVAISVALIEIMVGAVAGNLIGLPLAPWVNFLAGFGAILLTFLAGAEIDPEVVRRKFWPSMTIGVVGFIAPYVGVLLFARYLVGWPWPQAQIAGISLSTTSVAVVYAVMVETGFNRTELGKVILAACFVNDLGTVCARPGLCPLRSVARAVCCCDRGGAVVVSEVRTPPATGARGTRERAADQIRCSCPAVPWWIGQHRGQRSGAACVSCRYGARAYFPA